MWAKGRKGQLFENYEIAFKIHVCVRYMNVGYVTITNTFKWPLLQISVHHKHRWMVNSCKYKQDKGNKGNDLLTNILSENITSNQLVVAWWRQMATEMWVNIGPDNGLLPDGIKKVPEPMLSND